MTGNGGIAPGGDWRSAPIYSVAEVAALTGVHALTVRRWLYGEPAPSGAAGPLLVSFLSLVEILVTKAFRRRGVRLERVRQARDFAAARWEIAYPFASLRLRTLGGRILAEFEKGSPAVGSLLTLERPAERGSEQWTLPALVVETVEAIEFAQDELAERWFPFGKATPIVLDPRFAAGRPTIAGTGVTVNAVYARFQTGRLSIPSIADDLQLPQETVEHAVRLGGKVAA